MEIVGPMTAKEYFAEALRAADKPRHARKAELIDGVLILFPAPLDVHERLYVFLLRLLGEYAERSVILRIVVAGTATWQVTGAVQSRPIRWTEPRSYTKGYA